MRIVHTDMLLSPWHLHSSHFARWFESTVECSAVLLAAAGWYSCEHLLHLHFFLLALDQDFPLREWNSKANPSDKATTFFFKCKVDGT